MESKEEVKIIDKGDANNEDYVSPGPSESKEGTKRCLVTTDYKKESVYEISLIRGKSVKMLLPPDSEGYAFGEKKVRFGRKIKGYFPISHVKIPEQKD